MYLSDLMNKYALNESRVFYGHVASIKNGNLFIDGMDTGKDYNTIEEASQYIRDFISMLDNKKAIIEEYNVREVAAIIKKYEPNTRITNSLIESYVEQAQKKSFNVVPAIQELSEKDNKFKYILEDGSVVAIDIETQNVLNIKLAEETEIVDHMKKNKENFINVIRKITEGK